MSIFISAPGLPLGSPLPPWSGYWGSHTQVGGVVLRSFWGVDVDRIVLHVQECNTQAVQFYSRNRFAKVCKVKDYYTKVDGRDALFLVKQI